MKNITNIIDSEMSGFVEGLGEKISNDLTGLTVSNYVIHKKIGQGGMATVYLAINNFTKQKVAIKQHNICSDSDYERIMPRIEREYYFLQNINHPNIVKAYDFFEENGYYYTVLEYLPGITLDNLIKKNKGKVSIKNQIYTITQLCETVYWLNSNGIIHRDIKPQNIIIQKNFVVKLLDLGIAKNISGSLKTLTSLGSFVGTAEYASPEQIEGLTKRNTDVFSLGTVAYQFLLWLDKSPFAGSTTIETLNKINNYHPPTLDTIVNKQIFWKEISKTINKSMQKQYFNRYQNAKELLNDIQKNWHSQNSQNPLPKMNWEHIYFPENKPESFFKEKYRPLITDGIDYNTDKTIISFKKIIILMVIIIAYFVFSLLFLQFTMDK